MDTKKGFKPPKIVFDWKNVFLFFGSFLAICVVLFLLMFQKNGSAVPTTTQTKKELISEDILIGKGDVAENGMKLTVNYEGKLEDGTKFDSSYDRQQPFEFVLGQGQVIAGWDQGIVGMRVGGKRQLTIPPDLAYGEAGSPPQIPPNATLIFTVELLKAE